jgi:hypothetical protein
MLAVRASDLNLELSTISTEGHAPAQLAAGSSGLAESLGEFREQAEREGVAFIAEWLRRAQRELRVIGQANQLLVAEPVVPSDATQVASRVVV